VFTRPEDLTEGQIRAELVASWNFAAETLSYLPVGFGSHHWRAADTAGRQRRLAASGEGQHRRAVANRPVR